MRLLLDHCVDRRLARSLAGHAVSTAIECGWERLQNGRLLKAAAGGGFDAVITVDKSIPHQQNPAKLPIAVVLLRAVSNDVEELLPLVPRHLLALETLKPCGLVEVTR